MIGSAICKGSYSNNSGASSEKVCFVNGGRSSVAILMIGWVTIEFNECLGLMARWRAVWDGLYCLRGSMRCMNGNKRGAACVSTGLARLSAAKGVCQY